ncbi:hypothetical protein BURMUCGD1_5478 [Burkholderia multivorans CGD1]|nr:hypothetical protein BURMUCGD1_5478 [Burkholderia multivorans CGD1]
MRRAHGTSRRHTRRNRPRFVEPIEGPIFSIDDDRTPSPAIADRTFVADSAKRHTSSLEATHTGGTLTTAAPALDLADHTAAPLFTSAPAPR